jgi:hypothetical protein
MPWELTGNAGTNPLPIGPGVPLNFVGTTDNKGLSFKTNTIVNPDVAMFITPALTRDTTGKAGIGTELPDARLDVRGDRGSQSVVQVGGSSTQFQALLATLPKRSSLNLPPFQNYAIRGTGGDIGVGGEGSLWGVMGGGVQGAFGGPFSGVYGTCQTPMATGGNGVVGQGGPNGNGVLGTGGRMETA